jgi:branched-chain amino acid transport system permease protein
MMNDRTAQFVAGGMILCAILGYFVPSWVMNQLMFGFSRALAVLGLMVLWRTGLVSFGHAFYFGLGAYTVALLDINFGLSDTFARLAAAVIVSGLFGWAAGYILRNYRDIFFAMLSLALSMILYGILVKTEALGSTDGFAVSVPTFFGFKPEGKYPLFVAICVVCAISAVLVQAYLKSSLGRLTTAIRDNELRVEYLGYSVAQAIHVKYIMSACLTGAAGAMTAMALGQVDPDSMVNWTASGELVFVTILSGPGSVIAPFIGSVVFELLRTYAFELVPHAWQLIVGGTLLTIILFLPGGVWSVVEKLMGKKA